MFLPCISLLPPVACYARSNYPFSRGTAYFRALPGNYTVNRDVVLLWLLCCFLASGRHSTHCCYCTWAACFLLPPVLLVLVCWWWSLLQGKLPSCTATAEETAEKVVTNVGLSKALKRLEVIVPHVLETSVKDLACTQVAPEIIRPVH